MPRVYQGVKHTGKGWDRRVSFYEEYLCKYCLFRVRQYFEIISLGRLKEVESHDKTTKV